MIYAIDFLHISHQPINWIFCKKIQFQHFGLVILQHKQQTIFYEIILFNIINTCVCKYERKRKW